MPWRPRRTSTRWRESKLAAVEARLEDKMATKEQLRSTKEQLRSTNEQLGAMGVLMEKIDSKIDALSEGQTSMRHELVGAIHSHDVCAIRSASAISKTCGSTRTTSA